MLIGLVFLLSTVPSTTSQLLYSNSSQNVSLLEEYSSLVSSLISLPEGELECLRRQSFPSLKRRLDILRRNETDDDLLINEDRANICETIVEAYHNASIYHTIRGVWNSRVELPPIDQVAILHYFHQRQHAEQLARNFFQRIWSTLCSFFVYSPPVKCDAVHPPCIRRIVESLPEEDRQSLSEAIDKGEDVLPFILKNNQIAQSDKEELIQWADHLTIPNPLRRIIQDATLPQKEALQRLRDKRFVHPLRDYYRAMIERRNYHDQEEIRTFVRQMNETFAHCYEPIKGEF